MSFCVLLVGLSGCSSRSVVSNPASGYSYLPPSKAPHPGIAEGRAVVEHRGITFYACPPLTVGQQTPLITDRCLAPGDAFTSRYGDYSMLEPSVTCPDGRKATDAGGLGWGFVGQPFISQQEAAPGSPDRAALLECLRAAGRG